MAASRIVGNKTMHRKATVPKLPQAENHLAPNRDGDGTLAFRAVIGETTSEHELLDIICQRIRAAAKHLGLSRDDLLGIFGPYQLFEGEATALVNGKEEKFLIVQAHHLIQGKVGKGALKIILPRDLAWESRKFVEMVPRTAEVIPPAPKTRWHGRAEAWEATKQFLRELVTGETISMSLKCQATGTPFSGSEGVILCATFDWDEESGRFFIKPVLKGDEAGEPYDKELLEAIMNSAGAVLTRAGKIAPDRVVHAAETNSTLTSRLQLRLPSNVVEGHLLALLEDNSKIIIGDEDMTARLREILARPDYRPTSCALAKEAARIQREHSIVMTGTRERLRQFIAGLPHEGLPTTEQFREIVGVFFGSGETQQTEDQIYHHREPILRSLAAALASGCLAEKEDPEVLALFLRVLLDNQARLMKAALLSRMPAYEPLPADWFAQCPLFSPEQRAELTALLPPPHARKSTVKRGFVRVLQLLTALKDSLPANEEDHCPAARKEVLEQAIRALKGNDGILPCVERLRFFITPFTSECVTPKLAVVTRKPLEVCGSELRPEAMATGAVYALEEFFKTRGAAKGKPLDGLTVAIQGLGNAGLGVARLMRDRGARIVAVSDSRGALLVPSGLEPLELAALIEHKSTGKRLDTFPGLAAARAGATSAGTGFILHRNPDTLKSAKADILVLTATPAALDLKNVGAVQCKTICELTGAAVTYEAREALREKSIPVIPDNLASSGGLLVSLSEMLQNSFGQQWERKLEATTLRHQIVQSHDAILKAAKKHRVDSATAADILALHRMRALMVYRVNLGAAARQLKEQIEAIQDGETVLIISDDDDDGVASAAILRGLIAHLNPGREKQALYAGESLRSRGILDIIESLDKPGTSVKRVFVLDRSFPLSPTGQQVTAEIARKCSLVLINNHDLPEALVSGEGRASSRGKTGQVKSPAEMGILMIAPQTLKATLPCRHFTTALVLRELAHRLVTDPQALQRVDWQAAIGSCLDVPAEVSSEWLLFYAQFNPDNLREAAQAVRMVARAHGFMSAVRAVEGVERPDQMETNKAWEEFMTMYKLLAERVQLLVEKIVMENVGRPYVSHFFTPAEVTSPLAPANTMTRYLDLYPWISEHLTKRADFIDKPIIVGQVVQDTLKRKFLGLRIRSPRDVELLEVGLPKFFQTGGLPNTAVAKVPLQESVMPEQQFQEVVESIWWKTVSPSIQMKNRWKGI